MPDAGIFTQTKKGRYRDKMQTQWNEIILQATGARDYQPGEVIQSLWSGYGEIVRYSLSGTTMPSVVIKHVKFPSKVNHPRGWHNDHSHQRKVKSYKVEMAWYRDWADRCDDGCRVPHCLSSKTVGDEHIMILEDLDASGFPLRKGQLDLPGVQTCLTWLANFHATFLNVKADTLWPTGSYWHLATRPDELAVMDDETLRDAAPVIDSMLSNCQFKTLIHGDAKLANFCFSTDGQSVAAVDFQYIGSGCGMKDVAYFLSSCLSDREHEQLEEALLNHYFDALNKAIAKHGCTVDFQVLESEWRSLFPIAQADFYRFLVGWMPTHWKINDYNKRITLDVLAQL